MTAKAAAGFTLRTHKGIERGGGLLPALGAALLLAGIAGQVCSAMGMPVDGLLLLAGMAAAVIFMHRSNIGRILRGEENKFSFKSKKTIENTASDGEESVK